MNEQGVEQLQYQAGKGRKLWIGLFLPKLRLSHSLIEWLPDDAHVTLLHLGVQASDVVAAVCGVMENVAHWGFDFSKPLEASLTGVGWFWRQYSDPTAVVLVDSKSIVNLRSAAMSELKAHDIKWVDHYGFIPHVTMRQPVAGSIPGVTSLMSYQLRQAGSIKVYIPTLHVVCGDVKVAIT